MNGSVWHAMCTFWRLHSLWPFPFLYLQILHPSQQLVCMHGVFKWVQTPPPRRAGSIVWPVKSRGWRVPPFNLLAAQVHWEYKLTLKLIVWPHSTNNLSSANDLPELCRAMTYAQTVVSGSAKAFLQNTRAQTINYLHVEYMILS